MDCADANDDPLVPVTVVCGFLGAGKTTLITRLMQNLREDSSRCPLLIVNDFSQTNVDGAMLSSSAARPTLKELSGGCICCTLLEDFVQVLVEAVKPRSSHNADDERSIPSSHQLPSEIIVECTGLADPLPLMLLFLTHPSIVNDAVVGARLNVKQFVSVVDVSSFDTSELPLLSDQIKNVNTVVLNKVDAISKERLRDVAVEVRRANANCSIVPATYGVFGPELFPAHSSLPNSEFPLSPLRRELWRSQNTAEVLKAKYAGWKDDGIPESEKYGFTTFTYDLHDKPPFSEERLMQKVASGDALHGVVRSKGYFMMVCIDDSSANAAGSERQVAEPQRFLWSSVGRKFSYGVVRNAQAHPAQSTESGSLGGSATRCGIVFIGQQRLCKETIVAALESCFVTV